MLSSAAPVAALGNNAALHVVSSRWASPRTSPSPGARAAEDDNEGSLVKSTLVEGSLVKSTLVGVLIGAVSLALALFLSVFSELGFGATLFKAIAAGQFYLPALAVSVGLITLGYIFMDCNSGVTLAAVLALASASLVLAALLCFSSMPHAPLMASVVLFVVYLAAIYRLVYSNSAVTMEDYLRAVSVACGFAGMTGFAATCAWAASNFCWWGTDCKTRFRDALRVCEDMSVSPGAHCKRYGSYGTSCPQGCTEVPELSACQPEMQHCLAAFLLWSAPFLFSSLLVVSGIAVHFISTSQMRHREQEVFDSGLQAAAPACPPPSRHTSAAAVASIGASAGGASARAAKNTQQLRP